MVKGQSAPRKVTRGLRQKAWWLLRKNRAMTLAQLLQILNDGSQGNPETNLRGWLNKLHFAGILGRERIKLPSDPINSNGVYRYQLLEDLGPLPPVVRKTHDVLDPNSGKTHSIHPVKKGDL